MPAFFGRKSIIHIPTTEKTKIVAFAIRGIGIIRIFDIETRYDGFDNNGGGSWKKYINIPITTTPTEYAQYKVVIDPTNVTVYSADGTQKVQGDVASDFWANVKSDGSDIRVFDQDKNQMYFWIEKWDYANQTAVIWVKLPAGSTELNIAYGNPSATKSDYENPNKVFEEFTSFEDSFEFTSENSNSNGYAPIWGIAFAKYPNPVVSPVESYETDGAFNPAVIYEDGKFKMWYRVMSGGKSSIAYAESTDGINWVKYGVVLQNGSAGEPDSVGCEDPMVIKYNDTYYMFYAGYDGSKAVTMLAKSNDGINWTKVGVVLDVGASGSYDSEYAKAGRVVWNGSKWLMFYEAGDGTTSRVALAESDSLEGNWTKVGIVIDVRSGYWDSNHVSIGSNPILLPDGRIFMIYNGQDGTKWYAGEIIMSNDGRTILSRASNPILEPALSWEGSVIFATALVKVNDTWYLFYGGANKYVGLAKQVVFPYKQGGVNQSTEQVFEGQYSCRVESDGTTAVKVLRDFGEGLVGYGFSVWMYDNASDTDANLKLSGFTSDGTYFAIGVSTADVGQNYGYYDGSAWKDTGIARTTEWHEISILSTTSGIIFVIDGNKFSTTLNDVKQIYLDQYYARPMVGYFDAFKIYKLADPADFGTPQIKTFS